MQVPMSPVRILKRAVKLYPEKIAVVDGNIRWSYSQVQKRAWRVAHALRNLQIPIRGRVAVLDYNTYRYMELYFGAALSSRVLLPLNTRLTPEEYAYILNDSGAEAIIFHADFKETIKEIAPLVPSLKHCCIAEGSDQESFISGTYEDLILCASDEPFHREPKNENDLLNLYYTSGTTGRPKGVMLTHRNIYANALTTIISFGLKDKDKWFHIAPLFHLADAFFIWSVTYQGGTHVMQRSFQPKQVLQAIEKEKITAAMMVPTMINLILDEPDIESYDLSSLSWIMVGGAPMSPAGAKRMMDRLGCMYISGYGLTETTPLLTVGNIKDTLSDATEKVRLEQLTRTGLEVTGVDLKVILPGGEEVPTDGKSVGEIVVRGDNVMDGYWNLPDETDKAIIDGYFHTGDLATVNSEGYVLIVDRAKDIIISGGENISSVEVENAIYSHPDVLECAVIAKPHSKWGEVPFAMVTPRQGATLDESAILDHCKQKLAKFKVPGAVKFIPELPKTGSGKILKTELRKMINT